MRLPNASEYLRKSRDSQHNVPLTWLPVFDYDKAMCFIEIVGTSRWQSANHFPCDFPLAQALA